jgi:hypothetical protein
MMLDQIERNLAAKKAEFDAQRESERPKKSSKKEGMVTVGVQVSTTTRDRLAALKKHYGVKSISEVAARVIEEGLPVAERKEVGR